MTIKTSAAYAGWSVREAAWTFEERYLWPGQDATKEAATEALKAAQRSVEPLQRLVQTKVTWPLADALRERSDAARAGVTTAIVAAAVAAGTAGAMAGAGGHSTYAPQAPAARVSSAALVQTAAAAQEPALKGVVPEFEQGTQPAPAPAVEAPTEPPARVAWRFAQGFVHYEVGQIDEDTAAVFSETADPALANSLASSPPRLPTGTKVPEARVLNVVLGNRTDKQLTASVSLVRLRAVSEVRLTLKLTPDGWRVAQVLG
jgi:hypothetical protein